MQAFPIVIPPPAEPQKELKKTFDKLVAESASLAQDRATSTAAWLEASRQRDERKRTGDLFGAATAEVRMLELEISTLTNELALVERVNEEYLPAAIACRRHVAAVAKAIIPLAEQKVVEILQRDFDPSKWPIHPQLLAAYVSCHPVVQSAKVAAEEIEIGSENSAAQQNSNALRDFAPRLPRLQSQLKRAQNNVTELAQEAENARQIQADQQAKSAEYYKKNVVPQIASEKRAADEARWRVAS